MNLIEQIKSKITCLQMADILQLKVVDGRSKSYRPGSKNPTSLSFNLEEDSWFDFGDQSGGDCINLYAAAKGIDNNQAIKELAEYLNLKNDYIKPQNIEEKEYHAMINDFIDTCYGELSSATNAIEYLKSRGITGETAKAFKIGYYSLSTAKLATQYGSNMDKFGLGHLYKRIIIPFLSKMGKPYNLTGRAIGDADLKYRKLKKNEFRKDILFGLNTLRKKHDQIIIAEGMFDALIFAQEGHAVLSSSSTNFTKAQKACLIENIENKEIIICMDYDNTETRAGQEATVKLGKFLWENKIDAKLCFLGEEGDDSIDVNEYYLKNKNLNFLNKVIPYSTYMVKNDEECLEDLIRDICTNFSNIQQIKYKELFIRETKQASLIKEIFKEAKKAPGELFVCEKIANENDIIFIEKIGWLEYQKEVGIWEDVETTYIENLIGKGYGNFRTGGKISSTSSLLRSESYFKNKMNDHVGFFNTPEGFVNLNTKEVVPHKKEFYSTLQSEFSFNIATNYDFSTQFFKDISMGNEQDINYYHDILGELLIEDNRFCSSHFHLGSGSNGKSILLNIMSLIIGKKSTTNVGIHNFNKDFQMILLKDSLLNIATENNSHSEDCEGNFKQAVDGESITACYKGKDYISFTPRCKFHFAVNKLPRIHDKSDAFTRRMRLCDYKMKFLEEGETPQNAGEKIKDINFMNKVKENMNQFFNIAIDARNRLIKTNTLGKSSSHELLMQKVIKTANPIIEFIEKNLKMIQNGNNEIFMYNKYTEWCSHEHHKIQSKINFENSVKEQISKIKQRRKMS